MKETPIFRIPNLVPAFEWNRAAEINQRPTKEIHTHVQILNATKLLMLRLKYLYRGIWTFKALKFYDKIIFQDDGDYEADLRLTYLCKSGSLGAGHDPASHVAQTRPRSKSQAVSQAKSANYLNGLDSQEHWHLNIFINVQSVQQHTHATSGTLKTEMDQIHI